MKLFFDTNIWIRYFIGDNKEIHDICTALFKKIEKGTIQPYLSTIVLLEIYWVAQSVYKKTKAQAVEIIEAIVALRGIVIVDKTNFLQAFEMHKKIGVKLADCLISTQVGKGITLVTYDHEFQKIPGLAIAEPGEVLRMVK